MKKFTLAGALAISCLYVEAQETIKPLTVGDTVPDVLSNYFSCLKANSANQALPYIIEFFASYCNTCIASLPKLDRLQKSYPNKFSLLLVSEEPKQKVDALFKQQPTLKAVTLKYTAADTLLKQYFPHQSIPHLIWINEHGKIVAVTNAEQVTDKNIQKLLSGADFKLPYKNDDFKYHPEQPLRSQLPEPSTLHFETTVTGFIPNAKSNVYGTVKLDGGFTKKYFVNMGLLNILQIALGRIPANRFIIQSKNALRLINPRSTNAEGSPDLYSYEIILPEQYHEGLYLSQLLTDLGNASRLNIRVDTTAVDCYVLKKTPSYKSIQSKGSKPLFSPPKPGNPQLILVNQPLSRLITSMNAGGFNNSPPIVIDETAITHSVSLTLKISSLKDLPAIQEALAGYGLILQKTTRTIEMVIISDKLYPTTLTTKTQIP